MVASAVLLASIAAACAGEDVEPGADRKSPGDGSPPVPTGPGDVANKNSPGLRLLTRAQYKGTVEALLGVAVDVTRVPSERVSGGHGQIASAQVVDYAAVNAYYELGAKAAEDAVAKVACEANDVACVTEFANGFLRRAFRGGADDATLASYRGLLGNADAGDTAKTRLATLITTALSSPVFLHRQEIGITHHPTQPNVRILHAHEIATRLSYLVGESGPDEALLAAAEAEQLTDPAARVAQIDRFLASANAPGVVGFVRDRMGLYRGGVASKDPEVRAGTPSSLEASAAASFDRTVRDVLFNTSGSFAALLSADHYFVDDSVGPLVGINDATAAMTRRALVPAERAGILMHPFVLAAHTKESGVSPFPLGAFVYENVLCNVIGPPSVTPVLPEDTADAGSRTLRERLEAATSGPGCSDCHQKIGPSGFAFLPFDPLGRFTRNDKLGRPWDTTGTIPIGDRTVTFRSAAELSRQLADQPGAAQCVARRLFRWTFGRFEAAGDEGYVASLEQESIASKAAMRNLLVNLAKSEEFTLVRVGAP